MKTTPCQAHEKESAKQLTAIEWMESEFIRLGIYKSTLKEIVEQAKEKEVKQQSRERSIGYSNGYEAALKAFKPDVNINEH